MPSKQSAEQQPVSQPVKTRTVATRFVRAHRKVRQRLFASDMRWWRQVAGGGFWLVTGDGLTQLASVIRIMVLSRLLAPADFGLLGIALLVQQWLEAFTQTGIAAALIQKKGDISRYLDSAFTLQVVRGLAVAAALLAGAPLAGRFFDNGQAALAIRCLAVTTVLWGFNSPATVYLRKELRFRGDISWRLAGIVTNLVVAIPAAVYMRNAWSLILAMIAGRLAETVASYYICPYVPRFRIVWSDVRELMTYGKWVSFWNMFSFLDSQVDGLAVARFLGVTELGYYQVAGQCAGPLARLGTLVHGVTFPAFGKLSLPDERRRVFLATLALLAAVITPIACIGIHFADFLITLTLGPRWLHGSPALQALIWVAMARAISSTAPAMLLAAGHPRRVFEAHAAKLVLAIALMYLLMPKYGIGGAALAMAASATVAAAIQIRLAASVVSASTGQVLRALAAGLAAAVALVAVRSLPVIPNVLAIAAYAVVAAAGYAWALRSVSLPVILSARSLQQAEVG